MKLKQLNLLAGILAGLSLGMSADAAGIDPEVSYRALDLQQAFGEQVVPQKASIQDRWQYLG